MKCNEVAQDTIPNVIIFIINTITFSVVAHLTFLNFPRL